MPFPATEGRGDRRGKSRRGSSSFEPAGKIDILHQRHIGKAADLLENVATHEHSLIAGGDATESRSPIHHLADDRAPRRGAIESDVEPSTHRLVVGQGLFNHRFRIVRKLRIGVEKQ